MSKFSFLWESHCMLAMKNIFVSVLAGLQIDFYVPRSIWDILFWEVYRGGQIR